MSNNLTNRQVYPTLSKMQSHFWEVNKLRPDDIGNWRNFSQAAIFKKAGKPLLATISAIDCVSSFLVAWHLPANFLARVAIENAKAIAIGETVNWRGVADAKSPQFESVTESFASDAGQRCKTLKNRNFLSEEREFCILADYSQNQFSQLHFLHQRAHDAVRSSIDRSQSTTLSCFITVE